MTGSSNPFGVLQHRDFRLLWLGSLVSALGTAVGTVVFTWVIFTATRSSLAVALLGVVSFLPTVLFGLLAGAVIDRVDRRRLMLLCDVARCAALGALTVYTGFFGVSVGVILVAAFLVAAFSTIFRPATNAVIPRLVPEARFVDANGLLMSATTITTFVGSPIGGLLIVLVGVVGGLLANALTFGFSAAMIFLMVIPVLARTAEAAGGPRPSLLSEVREGLRYLRSQPALLSVTLSAMSANFFLSMYFTFIVVFAAVRLDVGATGFAVLLAANAAGWGIGGLLPGRLGTQRAPGLWYAGAWTVAAALIVVIGLSTSIVPALVATLGFGILGGIANTTFFSTVQTTVPAHLLGRYFATDEAGSFAMIPAGQIVGGFLILSVGISSTFVIAGAGAFVGNVVLLAFPFVRVWGRPRSPVARSAD